MAVEGLAKCMKVTLIMFNMIFVILGIACLGLGIWLIVGKNQFMELAKINNTDFDVPSLLQQGAYVLIGGGSFMLLIGLFGCVGACKESRILLGIYGALVLIVLIVELTAGILAAVFQGRIEQELRVYLKTALKAQYEGEFDSSSSFSLALDYVQLTYDCCGIDDHTDFDSADKWSKSIAQQIPYTCCKFEDKSQFPDDTGNLKPQYPLTCPAAPTTINAWVNKGCYNTIRNEIEFHAKIIIGIGVGVAVIELLGVIFAFYVCCKLREQNKVY